MHGIAKLLFGDGLAGGDGPASRDDDTAQGGPFGPGEGGWDLAERARRAGQWCGSTPGAGAIARALGDAGRPGRPRR
jgi:hypothetical protein